MTFTEKVKTINKKIKHNKAQYNLGKQTARIWALSSVNAGKYEFLTGEDVLPERPVRKRFEYLPLGSDLRKQTEVQTISRIRQGLWIWSKERW